MNTPLTANARIPDHCPLLSRRSVVPPDEYDISLTILRHIKRTRPLLWFLLSLAVFLAAGTAALVAEQRALLLEQVGQHAERELHLLGVVLTNDLVRHDYVAVRDSLATYGSQYQDIYAIKVIAPNGYVIADHRRPERIVHSLTRSYCVEIEPPSTACVDIELIHDLDPIVRQVKELSRRAIFAAILFAALMGSILWAILRKTAFIPLEQAVEDLHAAKDNLELRVAERTSDWMIANKELKAEIEERQSAERALAESEAKYRTVLENISEIIYLVSLADDGPEMGTVSFISGQITSIVGRRAEEFLSDPGLWASLIHQEDLAAVREATKRLVNERIPVTRLYRMLNRERGQTVWIEDRAVPQLDGAGRIIGYFGAARDITRRKQTEDSLKKALEDAQKEKNKTDAIIAAIGDGVSIQDRDFTVLYQNEHHRQMIGDHRGAQCYRAYEDRDSVCPGCPVALAFADGKVHTAERTGKTPDGPIFVEVIASPLRDSSGAIVAGIEVARNITERKQLEDERERMINDLRKLLDTISAARREWHATFDSIRDMISIHGEDYTILRANRAFAQNFGLEPRDVINRKCYELFHSRDSPVPQCPHHLTIERQEPVTEEISDPLSGRIFLVSTFPYTSPDSGLRGTIHIARDITEAKEKEMRLIMNERLASLGQMASGIAHEINNPLAAIAGCVDGLNRRINRGEYDPELFRKYLGIIKDEITRSKNITTSMLSVVRKSSYERKLVDVVETLEKAQEIIGFQGRLKQVEIRKQYPERVPQIHGSEGELKQVFLIVLTNALDAMADRGTVTLRISMLEERLAIDISDTGPGVAPDLRSRVFDPFFTTKAERGGTGLGLSIANRIISGHEGGIEILSGDPTGTTVRITLPLDESGAAGSRQLPSDEKTESN